MPLDTYGIINKSKLFTREPITGEQISYLINDNDYTVKDNNPEFENTDSIDEYDGEDTKEKYVLYCNEKNYKDKLESIAKSEVYNNTKEI